MGSSHLRVPPRTNLLTKSLLLSVLKSRYVFLQDFKLVMSKLRIISFYIDRIILEIKMTIKEGFNKRRISSKIVYSVKISLLINIYAAFRTSTFFDVFKPCTV